MTASPAPAADRTTGPTLAVAARIAWRNADRCIGRLYWQALRTRDLRAVTDPHEVHPLPR